MKCKDKLLDLAEVIDSLRVFPRIIIFAYLSLFIWAVVYFGVEYFHLPPEQRTVQMTAFSSVLLGTMAGAFPFVMKIYMDNGRDWDGKAIVSSTTTAVSSSTVTK